MLLRYGARYTVVVRYTVPGMRYCAAFYTVCLCSAAYHTMLRFVRDSVFHSVCCCGGIPYYVAVRTVFRMLLRYGFPFVLSRCGSPCAVALRCGFTDNTSAYRQNRQVGHMTAATLLDGITHLVVFFSTAMPTRELTDGPINRPIDRQRAAFDWTAFRFVGRCARGGRSDFFFYSRLWEALL